MFGMLDVVLAEERGRELLREAEGWRLASELAKARRLRRMDRVERGGRDTEGEAMREIEVRWGVAEDEAVVAGLMDLNGMPRWVAFEERFIVVEKSGTVLAALRYRTESKRLFLGGLFADPWGGEKELAAALYRGVVGLARDLGIREVLVEDGDPARLREAGYSHGLRGWHLDVGQGAGVASGGRASRVLAMFGKTVVPFFRSTGR